MRALALIFTFCALMMGACADDPVGPGSDLGTAEDTETSVDFDTSSNPPDTDGDSDVDLDTSSDPDTHANADSDVDSDTGSNTDTGSEDTGTDTVFTSTYDWEMYLTCDNQIDVYFGTPSTTTGSLVGQHTNWQTEGNFTAQGRSFTDYLYVVTASDQNVAQGFIGIFTNTTLGESTTTADDVWEVFAAGAHPETNPYCDAAPCTGSKAWPTSQLPTQDQVNTAILHATVNNLWVLPYSHPDYDLDASTPMTEFNTYWWARSSTNHPNLPPEARWIWHDSGNNPDTANAPGAFLGFNHDEFLVFRVRGTIIN